ncbi:hypothetical protein BH18ACT4_BH18ACT4_00330 [soil metagenome]
MAAAAAGSIEESLRWSEEGMHSARELGDPCTLTFSLAALALALTIAGDPAHAAELGAEAVDIARDLGRPPALAYALVGSGYALAASDPERAIAELGEAVVQAGAVGSQPVRGWRSRSKAGFTNRVGITAWRSKRSLKRSANWRDWGTDR